VTGSFAVPVPTDAVQSFAVYKTPYNAGWEVFRRIDRGGNQTSRRPVELQTKEFYSFRAWEEREHDRSPRSDTGFDFGGPLIAHKLLFSEIFQYDMKKRTVRGLPWPNDISKNRGSAPFRPSRRSSPSHTS